MQSNSNFQGVSSSQGKNVPTVPMSVYRELAGELQTTKKQLDGLKQQNQQLYQQNQSLRLEVSQLIQAVRKLEDTLNSWEETSPSHWQETEQTAEANHYYDFPEPPQEENWLTHQEENYPRQKERYQSSQEVNGWFLAAAVVMIVFTFAGIGFMVARPLMNDSGE